MKHIEASDQTHTEDAAIETEDALATDEKMAADFTVALTPQTDDPHTPAFTFRSVLLGSFWGVLLACANILFSFRTNAFSVPTGMAQLLSYPMGIFLAYILPRGILNPGPFSIKEHVLIYIIAGSAGGLPYGVDNVIGQHAKPFMNDQAVTIYNGLLWVASTQLVGYGVAGICRRFLVKPAAMYWPSVLPNVALFTALNGVDTDGDKSSKYKMSRFTFFWCVFAAIFLWQWLPGMFLVGLSTVSILCLITTNQTLLFLGSSSPGMGIGLGSFSFDWSIIGMYSPIATPWWATLNWVIGNITWQWIVIPICYYMNVWGSPALDSTYFLPDGSPFGVLNSNAIFNRNGSEVFVKRPDLNNPTASDGLFLLDQNFNLDPAKYDLHHPFFLTTFFAISYFTSFMNIATVVSHVGLWYGKSIVKQTQAAFRNLDLSDGLNDTHNVLMRQYRDFPEWVYGVWLAFCTVFTVLVCMFTPFVMPWWAAIFGIAMGAVMTVPIGLIAAVSGTQVGLNVLTEFVIGLMIPGQTIAVIGFKSLGYNVLIQALSLAGDLKLGHYMHISPISMFAAQLIGTLIGIIFNTGGAFYVMDVLKSPAIFVDKQWNGNSHATFLHAAGIWGAIGPARFFGIGTPYGSLMWAFLIGIALPFLPWIANKIYPHPRWYLINFPILTFAASPGGNNAFIVPVAVVGFIFQYYGFRYKRELFDKYNYVTSVALDSGMSMAVLAITIVGAFVGVDAMATLSVSPLSPATAADYYCVAGASFK